jgi:hypothetical protein
MYLVGERKKHGWKKALTEEKNFFYRMTRNWRNFQRPVLQSPCGQRSSAGQSEQSMPYILTRVARISFL